MINKLHTITAAELLAKDFYEEDQEIKECIRKRKNTYEYKRILEILEDYWLSEPEEDRVVVELHFYKGNEKQHKMIRWDRSRSGEV